MIEKKTGYYGTPRHDIIPLIPIDSHRILSVGCGGAPTEQLLQEQGKEVVGIEYNETAAEHARSVISKVFVGDAETIELDYPTGYFDCFMYADVLEHFAFPNRVLAHHLPYLKDDGTVVISIPNMRFWVVLYELVVKGDWPYKDQGIFDETHLRVFTLKNFTRLLNEVGLEVESVHRKFRLYEDTTRHRQFAERFAKTPLKEFFTHQYLFTARKMRGIKPE